MKKLIIAAAIAAGMAVSAHAEVKKIIFFPSSSSIETRHQYINKVGGTVVKDLEIIDSVLASFSDEKGAELHKAIKSGKAAPASDIQDDTVRNWLLETTLPQMPSLAEVMKQLRSGEAAERLPVMVATEEAAEAAEARAAQSETPWGIVRVNAPGAWAKGNMGNNVAVAVVDTGIDLTHPDLAANIAGNYNAIDSAATGQDDNGHGTHVAGTIAAVKDGKGVAGVAPKARLYAVKVLSAQGSGSSSSIVDGIGWAVEKKVSVINMSLGSPYNDNAIATAVKNAVKAGVTVVCAAGNDSGDVNYPAANPDAIAISASDSSDRITSFSSRGPEIDFIAPGGKIYSTFKGGAYRTLDGTSMASPHVAGLAVLAVSAGAKTPAQVRKMLNGAAMPINTLTAEQQGAGVINAANIK